MKSIEGVPWLGPVIVASGLFIASAIALLAAWSDVELVRTLAATPRATLAAPVPTPAVYRGRLYASAERSTPRGTRGAAFWWWVGKTGKYKRTSCTELASDHLVLRDAGKEARVEQFADFRGVSLLADGRSEWNQRRIIDLGSSPLFEGDVPPGAARCDGNNYEYQERVIPEGAEVEVLACHADGELRECKGHFAGVLALPSLSVHTWRRSQRAHNPVRAVAVLGGVALILLSILARRMRSRRHSTESRPESA